MAGPDLEPDRGDAEPGVASPAGLDLGALVGELGQEIAGPLTAALERVTALATSGRIDRASLARLRLEIESARRAGMVAQQLARLAHRHVRGAPETHRLTQLVRDALAQRSRELVVRDIDLRQSLQPARVRADGACLFAMLHALLDWSIVQAHSRLDVRIELQTWPLQAQLSVRLDRLPPGAADAPEAKTMAWRLVEVTTQAMGLELRHQERPGESFVTVAFPQTVNDQMDGVIAIELDHGFANSLNSKPLAGSHVLVIASKRELRTAIRDAIRHMGLMVDFTSSVEEAREFCDGGVPHAIVYESALGGERFGALRQALRAAVPATAFVAIGEDGRGYETTVVDGHPVTRVGRQALASALPAALVFELSRGIEA